MNLTDIVEQSKDNDMATIDIDRFIDIQDKFNHYDIALQEIKDGRKTSHWIWYIFPQIKGLGHSAMSQKYSIGSILEAKAYWENNILHDRLKEITEALLCHNGDSPEHIFGSLDAMKVKSCMTLFDIVSPNDIFKDVLDTFYGGERCKVTLSRVKKELSCHTADTSVTREYRGIARPLFTPNKLSELKSDEIFVFGSNLQGYHGGGAARAAMNRFGAEWGKGVGMQGQSYAIPTMQGGIDTIQPYVDEFIRFARQHDEYFFYVTRIGCGIAGFKDEDIAPLFWDAQFVENICLPESFATIIKPTLPKEMRQMMYGQMRTLVDLLKAFNEEKPLSNVEEGMSRIQEVFDRNVRYGDEFAFTAFRTLWGLINRYEENGDTPNLSKLEKDLYDFHKGSQWMVESTVYDVMYKYSVSKIVKYIQFLNDFRRYKNYDDIRRDLESIPVSHCSSNDQNYYFGFDFFPIDFLRCFLHHDWNHIAPNGQMDNELLEEVLMGRYQKALGKYGITELIRHSYGYIGCDPYLMGTRWQIDEPIYGPNFRINGRHIEKWCGDNRGSQEFEMRFASELLNSDENYIHIDDDRGNGYYIPRQDYSLPVYSYREGKLYFETEEEKMTFIKKYIPLKQGTNEEKKKKCSLISKIRKLL